jgi:deoxyribodipyrimidine photo-lyase
VGAVALVWFRRDLRVHDHPALHAAVRDFDRVVPVFVLDPALTRGRFASPARLDFLLGCLRELDASLRERGAGLVVRTGRPEQELPRLAREAGAEVVHASADVSPYARARETAVAGSLQLRLHPGNFATDVGEPRTRDGRPYTVFSPFHRSWLALPRRTVHRAPPEVHMPPLEGGRLPSLEQLGMKGELSHPPEPGEVAGRGLMDAWLREGIHRYHRCHDHLAGGTSGLSPYLHFGCVSARELEERVMRRRGDGPEAFRRQLAWRDFYAHVLRHHPRNAREEHQERYRGLEWDRDEELLAAWKDGRTGYPLVDAGMRQLAATGWMHNRARLVVGSFLTKDLHLDWRLGEEHFMRLLVDGDMANNNGNWQWVASVGVDPAPYFRRIFNPQTQQLRHDPDGEYVRRWVPELREVPDEHLHEPWDLAPDYPRPVVDHRQERERALALYRGAA